MKSLAGLQQLYTAGGGLHGSKQRQHGRAGTDTVVLVPVGTVVRRLRPPGQEPEQGAGDGAGDSSDGEADLPDWILRWHRPYSGADHGSCSDGEAAPGDNHGSMLGSLPQQRQQQQRQQDEQYSLLADLAGAGQEVVVARGGDGGRGNAGLRTRTLTAGEPRVGVIQISLSYLCTASEHPASPCVMFIIPATCMPPNLSNPCRLPTRLHPLHA